MFKSNFHAFCRLNIFNWKANNERHFFKINESQLLLRLSCICIKCHFKDRVCLILLLFLSTESIRLDNMILLLSVNCFVVLISSKLPVFFYVRRLLVWPIKYLAGFCNIITVPNHHPSSLCNEVKSNKGYWMFRCDL